MFVGTSAASAGATFLSVSTDNGDIAASVSLIGSGLFFFFGGLWFRTRDSKRQQDLENDLRIRENHVEEMSGSIREHCDGALARLANLKLNFGRDHRSHCRISFYLHSQEAAVFTLNARFSPDPEYRKTGRSTFPDDQGVIAKCWRDPEGVCFHRIDVDPLAQKQEYMRAHRDLDLPMVVIRSLRMKSQVYFGWRVKDTTGSRPLGVFLVESTNCDEWTQEELIEVFESEAENLRSLAQQLMPWALQPVLATEEQF